MKSKKFSEAIFGGGCFWCTEAVFASLKGIISVTPGYSGGDMENPTYEQVCAGSTGHVEVVKIVYDPEVINFSDLLTVFFNTHDPTTKDRQGLDVGTQYRSVIFYVTSEQKNDAESFISDLAKSNAYDNPIVTEVKPFKAFYPAEDYHRKFYEVHRDAPYCQIVIGPKLEKIQKRFSELLK